MKAVWATLLVWNATGAILNLAVYPQYTFNLVVGLLSVAVFALLVADRHVWLGR